MDTMFFEPSQEWLSGAFDADESSVSSKLMRSNLKISDLERVRGEEEESKKVGIWQAIRESQKEEPQGMFKEMDSVVSTFLDDVDELFAKRGGASMSDEEIDYRIEMGQGE